ncbi:hypothetical protein C8J57DRAFT_1220347 [Mycena rebaudengoi]|nr:hypothetical protein C8J57DRAFT_1220347 [Mycena rebaudengoi]
MYVVYVPGFRRMSPIRSYDYDGGRTRHRQSAHTPLAVSLSAHQPSRSIWHGKTHAAPSRTAPHTPAHPIARVWRAPITAGAIGMARGARPAGQQRVHTTDRREASLRVWVRALRVSPEKMRAVPDPLYRLAHSEVDPRGGALKPQPAPPAYGVLVPVVLLARAVRIMFMRPSCAGGERARERRRRHQALLALALINSILLAGLLRRQQGRFVVGPVGAPSSGSAVRARAWVLPREYGLVGCQGTNMRYVGGLRLDVLVGEACQLAHRTDPGASW